MANNKSPVIDQLAELQKFDQLKSISNALVAEIDNVMLSNLEPNQIGQVLGQIIKVYKDRLSELV